MARIRRIGGRIAEISSGTTMTQQHAIFLVNLLQDVSVIRPLVFMAARDLGLRTAFLVSRGFVERDTSSTWQAELDEIGDATGAPGLTFEDQKQAVQLAPGQAGDF